MAWKIFNLFSGRNASLPQQPSHPASGTTDEHDIALTEPSSSDQPTDPGASPPDNDDDEDSIEYPEFTWRTGLGVLGGFLCLMVTSGLGNCIGVLTTHLGQHQLSAISPADIGWIPGINSFFMHLISAVVGKYFDRKGARPLICGGGILFVLGLVGMASAHLEIGTHHEHTMLVTWLNFGMLLVSYGFLCSTGMALVSVTVLGAQTHWFRKRRGIATGIVLTGSGAGAAVYPVVLHILLERVGWSLTVGIMVGICTAAIVVGWMLIRSREDIRERALANRDLRRALRIVVAAGRDAEAANGASTLKQAPPLKRTSLVKRILNIPRKVQGLSSSRWLTGKFFFSAFALGCLLMAKSGVQANYPAWVLKQGFNGKVASIAFTVLNIGVLVARVVLGIVSDRVGAINTQMATLSVTVILIFTLGMLVGDSTAKLYILSAILGLGTGTTYIALPMIAAMMCEPCEVGLYIGRLQMAISVVPLLAMPLSAWIVDKADAHVFVVFIGYSLVAGLLSFCVARVCFLNFNPEWKWRVKV